MVSIQKALAEYQGGRLEAALDAAEKAYAQASVKEKTPLQVLLSNICLKLGDKVKAADFFADAAGGLPEKRAEFLKFATRLYASENAWGKLIDVAPKAGVANLDDKTFLFELAKACQVGGNLAAAASFIADLDLSHSAQFMLLNEFGAALGDDGAFNSFLQEACRNRPENVMLLSLHASVARGVCDFKTLDAFDQMIADPSTPLARGLLENELAFHRLLRSEDEAGHLLPSYDVRAMQIAGGLKPSSRRAFVAKGERMRIGYLSNDFYEHVTMRLFEEVMLSHDRERFDIRLFCYSDEKRIEYQRQWPEELRNAVTFVGDMSDADAARAIDAANVDILVDLKGFTKGARLGIVRRSTAPVKATYLGYPGSVREVDLDYAITDPIVTPDSSKPYYEEKLCRLPETYQANGSRKRVRPENCTRTDLGLPEGRLVLGSFNAPSKMAPGLIRLWSGILERVPDAVLHMLCVGDEARKNVAAAFAEAGTDPKRVIFFGFELYPRFLARINAVDIALDAFPYNGHTTTSDILWVGTPMVTRKGSHFAGRVSESLLTAFGMQKLVAQDNDGYCDLAVELAGDLGRLKDIRTELEANRNMMPLFDTERFTCHLELAYEAMADRARRGLQPDHMDIEALPARNAAFMA